MTFYFYDPDTHYQIIIVASSLRNANETLAGNVVVSQRKSRSFLETGNDRGVAGSVFRLGIMKT